MKWKKYGNIYAPKGGHPALISHAANPVADHYEGDLYKIYFSGREKNNRASIGYIIIDINNPSKVIHVSEEPVLSHGDIGTFDDSGVSMGCIVNLEGDKRIYYLGWNLGVTVPWRNSIGMAFSTDGVSFQRYSQAPVLDRNHKDPFSISYPFILCDQGVWRMWYGSNLRWGTEQNEMDHLLKYAESDDGINWRPSGEISVNFASRNEYAMSKPSVIKENGIYKMWYSYRGDAYRIGYAESEDGIHFERMDEKVGITVSDSGWDSESIEYPNVFMHEGAKYMLYNGNQYGLTGIGLAISDE